MAAVIAAGVEIGIGVLAFARAWPRPASRRRPARASAPWLPPRKARGPIPVTPMRAIEILPRGHLDARGDAHDGETGGGVRDLFVAVAFARLLDRRQHFEHDLAGLDRGGEGIDEELRRRRWCGRSSPRPGGCGLRAPAARRDNRPPDRHARRFRRWFPCCGPARRRSVRRLRRAAGSGRGSPANSSIWLMGRHRADVDDAAGFADAVEAGNAAAGRPPLRARRAAASSAGSGSCRRRESCARPQRAVRALPRAWRARSIRKSAGSCAASFDQLPDLLRRQRHIDVPHAERRKRIHHRVHDRGRAADGAGLAHALHARADSPATASPCGCSRSAA